jgi:hypothetical protein
MSKGRGVVLCNTERERVSPLGLLINAAVYVGTLCLITTVSSFATVGLAVHRRKLLFLFISQCRKCIIFLILLFEAFLNPLLDCSSIYLGECIAQIVRNPVPHQPKVEMVLFCSSA